MIEENQEPETINLGEPEGEIHTVNLWVRLGNWVIDQFILAYLFQMVYYLAFKIGYHLPEPLVFSKGVAPVSPYVIPNLTEGYYTWNPNGYLIIYLITFLYYFIMESLTAQTIGKMITRTMVVNRYGEKPIWYEVALRSLCRFIPFVPLSFIPSGISWYDKISQTYVKQRDPIIRNF